MGVASLLEERYGVRPDIAECYKQMVVAEHMAARQLADTLQDAPRQGGGSALTMEGHGERPDGDGSAPETNQVDDGARGDNHNTTDVGNADGDTDRRTGLSGGANNMPVEQQRVAAFRSFYDAELSIGDKPRLRKAIISADEARERKGRQQQRLSGHGYAEEGSVFYDEGDHRASTATQRNLRGQRTLLEDIMAVGGSDSDNSNDDNNSNNNNNAGPRRLGAGRRGREQIATHRRQSHNTHNNSWQHQHQHKTLQQPRQMQASPPPPRLSSPRTISFLGCSITLADTTAAEDLLHKLDSVDYRWNCLAAGIDSATLQVTL